jgi:hypothetical protein
MRARTLLLLLALIALVMLTIAAVTAYSGTEAGYRLSLVTPQEYADPAPENGYTIACIANPTTVGVIRTEGGYSIGLNVYTSGVGGVYNEVGYHLYLVPEQAFISYQYDITANDPVKFIQFGALRGTLTYACNGTGIADGTVNLTQNGTVIASVTSDTSGQYNFTNLIVGAYVVNVSKRRCFDNGSTVTIVDGENAVANLTLWLKGDLNNNCIQADAGDLAKLKDASVGKIGKDWRFDLNSNTIYADAGDLAKLKDASVGKIELV